MTLREFLNNQGKRAGLNDDSDFAMLLSASALGELEIPESVAQKFESNLLTMDIAKNNLDLKTHFIRNYMMGYDEELCIRFGQDLGMRPKFVGRVEVNVYFLTCTDGELVIGIEVDVIRLVDVEYLPPCPS